MLVGRHNEIHITPAGIAASGKKATLGKVVLGVALIGTAFISGGATLGLGAPALFGGTAAEISFGQIALFGASIALTGASQLLAGNPTVPRYENREAPEDRPNFLFNGGVNTIQEGPAITWVWGKDVFVGSNVISAGIVNEQTGPVAPLPAVDGLLASFSGSASGAVI
jgi:predicted phage tail protein